jgi:2-polyprenyl-3-methyl-5-hydroxy-6-metoxy-1,4-benzoquinol methylase
MAHAHWEATYAEKGPHRVSWHQVVPRRSLELIEGAAPDQLARLIDVGGGASSLAAELLRRGYVDVTVADISAGGLEYAKTALGEDASRIAWVQADVRSHRFARTFDLWHDRAVFHFMVDRDDRDGYLATLRQTLAPNGHLVISTFGPDGPTQCSALPVQRYDAESLQDALGHEFRLLSSNLETHRTPSGAEQQFLYAHLQRAAPTPVRPAGS